MLNRAKRPIFIFLLLATFATNLFADFDSDDVKGFNDDDLTLGGDIFNDFNEDLDAAQVLEDERFYEYGRFFAVNFSMGVTTFTGNRGAAYEDEHPTFGLSVMYFSSFQMAYTLGFALSKHSFSVNGRTRTFDEDGSGLIQVSLFRAAFGMRYYIDTADLGTAITYSNPYLVGNIGYWYQSNKFTDREEIDTQNSGAFGVGVGLGLEFPIELKESYINVEGLFHTVNLSDSYTKDYAADPPGGNYGYDDLTGNALTLMVSYVISW